MKDNLTTKDVLDKITELYDKNALFIGDLKDAVGNLKNATDELKEAKDLYKKPISYVIKKILKENPKLSIISFVFLIIATLCFLNNKNISFLNREKTGIETNLNISPNDNNK